jgi:hypothetical protein
VGKLLTHQAFVLVIKDLRFDHRDFNLHFTPHACLQFADDIDQKFILIGSNRCFTKIQPAVFLKLTK